MIIRHLHIDNFGCFHNFDLDLTPNLNCFTWPNEGGKSTCLEFIRRIFWGFPDKRSKLNPYPALNGSGHYGGYLDVITAQGEALRLERRGERAQLKIIHSDGAIQRVSDIGKMAGISETFYRNVCAVTIDELTAFAALDDTEIRNRLYGNALNIGEYSLSELQQLLAEKAAEIYKKKGFNHSLKKLSDAFEQSENRLAQLSQNLPAYEKAVLKAEEIETESLQLKSQLESLYIREKELEDALAAAEFRNKLIKDEEAFARSTPPRPMPPPLPPFSLPIPDKPRLPSLEDLPFPPQAPHKSGLEGKCDFLRAATVETADFTELAQWCNTQQDIKQWPFYAITGAVLIISATAACISGSKAALFIFLLLLLATGILRGRFYIKHARIVSALKKRKEHFLYKFLIAPEVSQEEYPELLAALMKFQKAQQEYEKQLEAFTEKKTKYDKLRIEYELRLKLYNEQMSEYTSARNAYEAKQHSQEKLCREITAAQARYEAEKLALIKRRNELPPEQFPAPCQADLEAIRQQINELKHQLEENCRRSGAERRESMLLLQDRDCAVELNIREQQRGKMRSAAERYLTLTSTRLLLERAVERCERKHQPELLKLASLYFASFTNGIYSVIYKQLSTNTLRVSDPQTRNDRAVTELSRGTREQLFLALRLALIASLENNAEPLPVVLDDILVNFDTKRKASVRQGIETFAAAHQVLLFECQ